MEPGLGQGDQRRQDERLPPSRGDTDPERSADTSTPTNPEDTAAVPRRRGVSFTLSARLPPVVAAITEDDRGAAAAVLRNVVALIEAADPVAYQDLSDLVDRLGHRKVALIHADADRLFRTGADLPVATALARTLTDQPSRLLEDLHASGIPSADAIQIIECSTRCAFWLVVTGVDPRAPGRALRTVDEAVACIDHGTITDWRAQLAIIAANPWLPYPTHLSSLLHTGNRPVHAQAVATATTHYRHASERHERTMVAREIRRLVAISGLSQREFAARVGTSASRLSTYANGKVTPSAAMMLRIQRATRKQSQSHAQEN